MAAENGMEFVEIPLQRRSPSKSKEASTLLDFDKASEQNAPELSHGSPRQLDFDETDSKLAPKKSPFNRSFQHFRRRIYGRHSRFKFFIISLILLDVLFFLMARFSVSKFNINFGPAGRNISRVFMLLFFQLTLFLGSIFIYRRIASVSVDRVKEEWKGKSKIGLKLFAISWIFMTHISWVFYNVPLPDDLFIAVLCFLALGAYFHCFAILLIFFFIERVSNCCLSAKKFPILQSKSLHTIIAITLALILTVQGFISATQRPTLKTLNLSIKNLPEDFDNFSVTLVSDIHIGPSVGVTRVKEIVDVINGVDSDIVAVVGDTVDGYVGYIDDRVKPLSTIKSNYGTFLVLGNHEYIHDNVDNWIDFFKDKLNFTALVNDAVIFKKNEKELCLAGVDDYFTVTTHFEGHLLDTEKALRKCSSNSSTILLSHQPNGAAKVLSEIERINKRVDLILSGHTHGGQMYIVYPFGYLLNHFFYGLYLHQPTQTQVYVSSGVDFWGPPIKMYPSLCEIVNIRLHSS